LTRHATEPTFNLYLDTSATDREAGQVSKEKQKAAVKASFKIEINDEEKKVRDS